jgi:hypothetical protein
MRTFCLIFFACLLLSMASATGREIFVDNRKGDDQHAGTADAPLRSARRAVSMAAVGDTIHLLPAGAVYREMIIFRRCTIECSRDASSDFVVGPNVNVTIEDCSFKGIRFKVDPAASVQVSGSNLDGQPLKISR